MSVNQIDVNAVNERTRAENHAGSTPQQTEGSDEREVLQYAKFLRGSLKARMTYTLMRFVMVLESIVWTLMDFLRAIRLRLVTRINKNYQLYRTKKKK